MTLRERFSAVFKKKYRHLTPTEKAIVNWWIKETARKESEFMHGSGKKAQGLLSHGRD